MSANKGEEEGILPLFETKAGKGRGAQRLICFTTFTGIVLIWGYRLIHIPASGQPGRLAWIALFLSELMFGLYWIATQAGRWCIVHRRPFRDRLLTRFKNRLPGLDIFVCTADPKLEPPSLVINTVLSVMSYNYPPENLSVYLSDDGCSELTFYALLEASEFSKYWIPFTKKYNVEPRAPERYFAQNVDSKRSDFALEWTKIKTLYDDMKSRIGSAAENACIPKDQHKGFAEWDSGITKQDHQSIVQVLIDGWNPNVADDVEGNRLPALVYMSREKRPGQAHNFKAGAMNSLIRVSSEISNAPIILTLDCDMYSNDPDAILDALCFFMDEKQGQQISFVQYPQRYYNITKNDIYGNAITVTYQVELSGLDGFGTPLYIGTGCFHRRESLSGERLDKNHKLKLNGVRDNTKGRAVEELESASKCLADCSYEKGTLWGQEMGLVYGCAVEDIITGLIIPCRGWVPVYTYPSKDAFLGLAPTSLETTLLQFQRWSTGLFQIFLSKYCPFIYGHGKIKLGAQMAYCMFLFWAPVSLPVLCYLAIPAVYMLHNVPLFPEVSSSWFLPFAYVYAMRTACSLAEELMCGNTVKGWWNLQRMWLFRRATSSFFAVIDTVLKQLGLSEMSFTITDKIVDDEQQKRYEEEVIEFGSSSIMFTMIATFALLNLFSLVYGVKRFVFSAASEGMAQFVPQIIISSLIVMVNIPVYEALFFRKDNGRLPSSVLLKSIAVAAVACFFLHVLQTTDRPQSPQQLELKTMPNRKPRTHTLPQKRLP